jgi:hypothetical protein
MKKTGVWWLLFMLIPLSGISAQSSRLNGEMVYVEGYVDVHRDGKVMDWRNVDIGLILEQYDLVETGDDGYAEIEVDSPSSRGNMVRVFEDTAFYFDFDDSGGKERTKFEVLTGSLSLKVQRLTGTGDVVVKTESAVMGVRGTEFTVTAAPEGSVLISCKEGSVSCTTEGGEEKFSKPGTVVEQPRDGGLREISVELGELDAYRRDWFDQKIESFIPSAGIVVKGFARQYKDLTDRFNSAYNELMQHSGIFNRWERDLKQGKSMGSAVKDKIEVSPAVFRMRSIIFMYERLYYRIKSLKEIYKEYNIPSSRLWSGYSTTDLFREFERNQKNIAWKLAQTRYIFKLYGKMTSTISPGGGFPGGNDPFGDSDPFGEDKPFGGDKPF